MGGDLLLIIIWGMGQSIFRQSWSIYRKGIYLQAVYLQGRSIYGGQPIINYYLARGAVYLDRASLFIERDSIDSGGLFMGGSLLFRGSLLSQAVYSQSQSIYRNGSYLQVRLFMRGNLSLTIIWGSLFVQSQSIYGKGIYLQAGYLDRASLFIGRRSIYGQAIQTELAYLQEGDLFQARLRFCHLRSAKRGLAPSIYRDGLFMGGNLL